MKKFFSVLGGCLYPLILYVLITTAVQMAVLDWEVLLSGGGGIFSLFSGSGGEDAILDNILLLSGVGALFSIVVMYAIMVIDRRKWGPVQARFHVPEWVILTLGGLGFSIGINLIISMAAQISGIGDEGFNEVSEIIFSAPLWVQVAVAAFLIPIVEEQIFRGIIQRRIAVSYGAAPALFFSSLIFGIFHGNLVQGVYAFLVGLYLAYVYTETGNLFYCICIHMLANLSSIVLSRMAFWEGAEYLSVVVVFFFLVLFGACIYSLFYLRKRKNRWNNGCDKTGVSF